MRELVLTVVPAVATIGTVALTARPDAVYERFGFRRTAPGRRTMTAVIPETTQT